MSFRMYALAGALLSLAAGNASAAPLSGAEIQVRAAGGEFRGFGRTRRAPLEDVIWRFRPDGTVTSVSVLRRKAPISGGQFEEYGDAGTWRIDGNRLCVEFGGVHRDFNGCYAVDSTFGEHVQLSGPLGFEGTLSR